jgi:tryptophan 2,3-dioxygenase
VNYSEYLRLPSLLSQCVPRSTEHDELLFITVHQTCELWFRQILTELNAASNDMQAGETYPPRLRMRRCHAISRMLAAHFDVLDTMTPPDFLRFRDTLGTASGAQSKQFHQIEALSRHGVWDAYLTALAKAGFPVATQSERLATYREITMNRRENESLWELTESLIDHDQAWSLFRLRHAHTVERQIGHKPGTAHTQGVKTLTRPHFYPELWQLRTEL